MIILNFFILVLYLLMFLWIQFLHTDLRHKYQSVAFWFLLRGADTTFSFLQNCSLYRYKFEKEKDNLENY